MKTIRVKNLRNIIDSDAIELKPISILVGNNSSGKSTFLRVLALLKQSVETPTEGPLLWFGRYVDFGSHTDALRKGADHDAITIEFQTSLSSRILQPIHGIGPVNAIDVSVSLDIAARREAPSGYVRRCSLTTCGLTTTYSYAADGSLVEMKTGTLDILSHIKQTPINPVRGQLIPTPTFGRDNPYDIDIGLISNTDGAEFLIDYDWPDFHGARFSRVILAVLAEHLPRFVPKKQPQKQVEALFRLPFGDKDTVRRGLLRLTESNKKSNRAMLSFLESEENLDKASKLLSAAATPMILRQLNAQLRALVARTEYMGPLRATAERYYRPQNLAVREVDSRGENLPMFLRSLTPGELSEFSQFCKRMLDFSVFGRNPTGQFEIQIAEGSDESEGARNLTDVGFGFSQILPVLAQIWGAGRGRYARSSDEPRIIAIEQPELHLHPALQSRIADLLVAAAKEFNIRFVVETHSETIIGRLGELTSAGALSPDACQIVVFNRTSTTTTTTQIATFDRSGGLHNWPFGFFLPSPTTPSW